MASGAHCKGLRARFAPVLYDRMKQGKMPEMIWVLLDESSPTGTHEFADSVNNGPWGAALTTELIPDIEAQYRMDARTSRALPAGTFLRRLGNTVASDPLSKDLRRHLVHFARPQRFSFLQHHRSLCPNANFYRGADGTLESDPARPWPAARNHAAACRPGVGTWRLWRTARLIRMGLLSARSGWPAAASFQSRHRGYRSGRGHLLAQPLRHRRILERQLEDRSGRLRGKIHLVVGTDDTFYLDGAAHSLESALNRLGGEPHFTSCRADPTSMSMLRATTSLGLVRQIARRCLKLP